MSIDPTLEQVARELRACTKRNGGTCRGDDHTGWLDYVDDARSVMAAARIPSENMMRAAASREYDDSDKPWPEFLESLYTSMVDRMTEKSD